MCVFVRSAYKYRSLLLCLMMSEYVRGLFVVIANTGGEILRDDMVHQRPFIHAVTALQLPASLPHHQLLSIQKKTIQDHYEYQKLHRPLPSLIV